MANIFWSFTVAAATVPMVYTHQWLDIARRRSGLAREEAGPAGQYLPVIHRRSRHRIRGQARSYTDTRMLDGGHLRAEVQGEISGFFIRAIPGKPEEKPQAKESPRSGQGLSRRGGAIVADAL